jgi:hypothetical protein
VKTGFFSIEKRISAFSALGGILRDSVAGVTGGHAERFAGLIGTLHISNPWFTPENVRRALSAIGTILTAEMLHSWLSAYPELNDDREPCTAGVVLAGNIPLAGFHDLLCVLVTGNRLQAKLSTKDEPLMRAVADTLISLEPAFKDYIQLTTDELSGFDMVIATGSNNTSRYFEYYFRNIPSIIRHNRNSIAIIDGTETATELALLGNDIFSYFGLGCRNVSKLYIPAGYDVTLLPAYWERFETLRGHYKYAVNYDHNKAVMIVNREPFTDAGFVILRHDTSLTPPMAVVNYEYYDSPDMPEREAERLKSRLQCVAGHGHIPFGNSQQPEIWDYADNIDTISFLLKINPIRQTYIKKY